MTTPSSPSRPNVNPWVVALTVTLATFMELLDTSIANVSLPYIGGGLGRSFDEVTWILTTYLVANAVVLPMSAWLSRVMGRKNYYQVCVVLFSLASLFCGLAPSLSVMLAARVVQGLGGGGLAPVAQAILIDTFPPHKRASAFALYTVVIVTAPAIGPVLGGWITENYDWRWIFFINVPLGALSIFLANRYVHEEHDPNEKQKRAQVRSQIDIVGILLIAAGSAALEVLLDRGQIDDWFGSTLICWLFAIAILSWGLGIFWELRHPTPVVDFRMLGNRNFAIANVLFFVFGVSIFGTTTLIPQILQSLYGYRALDAGLVLGPGALVITALAPVAAQLVQRNIVHPRSMLVGSLTIIAASMFYYSHLTLETDYGHYAFARAYQGLGYAFFFVPVNVIAYSYLRPDQNNRASSLTNFFRNWGGSFGIAFISTMSERRQNYHQTMQSSWLAPSSFRLQQSVANISSYLQQHGYSAVDATRAAYGRIYSGLEAQTRLLAFMDCFRAIGWLAAAAIPLLLLVRHFHAGGTKPPAGH